MSNRLLGFLLLIGIPAFFYLIYLIFFVSFVGTLNIISNVDNYKVELFAKKYGKKFSYSCEKKDCELTNISPLDYTISINKQSYKEYLSEFSMGARGKQTLNINLIKDTKLTQLNDVVDLQKTLNSSEKITEIKLKKDSFYLINLDNLGYFYFKKTGNSLTLYKSLSNIETKLGIFPLVSKEKISIQKIFGIENNILIELDSDKYIYDLVNLKLSNFKLTPKIIYSKTGDSQSNYLFVTELGTYIYNDSTKNLEYFYLFKDFVFNGSYYIGLIEDFEKQKILNFGIKSKSKNIIIKYNPKTLERSTILETDIKVNKILVEGDKIYFYNDDSGDKYVLENF